MEMEIAVIENVTHVKLRGRLDTHGVDEIETKFTASIVPSGRNALIDLSELEFISSMGIRMIIAVKKALGRHKGMMVMFAPQSQVSGVFDTASLTAVIPVVRDKDEAMARLEA
jgi:anti-sigma B factor antagonist